MRTGGWAFGLRVARSVRPGGQAAGETPKVSAKEFAALADCSPERVMRYYKAWDKAADDGVVPHFEALAPGAEVELPGADLWLTYYSSRSSAGSERGVAISEAAEAEGIRPTKALEVAENPTALRAAIMADPRPPAPPGTHCSTGSRRTRTSRPSWPVTSSAPTTSRRPWPPSPGRPTASDTCARSPSPAR